MSRLDLRAPQFSESELETTMLYDEMGRLAGEAFRLNARMVQNAMLLTVAMNYAWTASRRQEVRRTGSQMKAPAKRPV